MSLVRDEYHLQGAEANLQRNMELLRVELGEGRLRDLALK